MVLLQLLLLTLHEDETNRLLRQRRILRSFTVEIVLFNLNLLAGSAFRQKEMVYCSCSFRPHRMREMRSFAIDDPVA